MYVSNEGDLTEITECPIKGAPRWWCFECLDGSAAFLPIIIAAHHAQSGTREATKGHDRPVRDDAFLRPGWEWLPPTQADDPPRAPSTDYTEYWCSAFYKCHHVSEVCTQETQIFWFQIVTKDFPGGAVIKDPPAKVGGAKDVGSIPGSGRAPGGRNGKPVWFSCLENSMGKGAQAIVHRAAKSWTWLSN